MAHFTHQQALDRILQRAATDPQFRRRLLAEPHAAIDAAFGNIVPAALTLRFIERDPDVDVLAVLPDLVQPGAALSLDELDVVAGGVAEAWSDDDGGDPDEP